MSDGLIDSHESIARALGAKRLTFHALCDGCVFEAWERMTYGGVQLGNAIGSQYVHRDWGHDATGVSGGCVSHGWQIPTNLRRTANGIQVLRAVS